MTPALLHPHDQAVRLTSKDLAVLDSVDRAVQESLSKGDPRVALNFGLSLRRSGEAVAVGIAKLAAELKSVWSIPVEDGGFGLDAEDFADAVGAAWGYAPATIRKYVSVWEVVLKDKPQLMGKPMEALMLVTGAARDGDLTDDDWKRIETAPDKATIRDIVREKRGHRTSSKLAMTIFIERDGTLKARGGNKIAPVGMLAINSPDPLVQAAIERIIRALEAAGIVRR